VGFQESLACEGCHAQLLEDVEQVHFLVEFVLGFLEKHTFYLFCFVTPNAAAAEQRRA